MPTPRATRIKQYIEDLISRKIKINSDHMKELLTDVKDTYVEAVLPNLVKLMKKNIHLITDQTKRESANELVNEL
jgi:hypothetical protein